MKLLPKIIFIFLGVSVLPIVAFTALSIWAVNQQREDIATILTMTAVIFSSVSLFLAIQFAKYLTDPIVALKQAAGKIRGGDLSQRVSFKSKDELGDLSDSFNSMALSIQQTSKIRTDFINLASHHLRTPNTEISWALDELILNIQNPTKEQKLALETIVRGVQSLHDISETLLNISEAQMGNIVVRKKTFDMINIVNELIKGYQEKFAQKGIKLTIEAPAGEMIIESDPNLMRSAVRVLIDNAFIYTKTGEVKLSIKKSDKIIVSVSDTGAGIPADQLDNVFNEFYQAENAKTINPTGYGLGLYLARTAIRNLGGDITVHSELDKGSTFTITI